MQRSVIGHVLEEIVGHVLKEIVELRPCLVHLEIQKLFKISRHIKSCGTCMKH